MYFKISFRDKAPTIPLQESTP